MVQKVNHNSINLREELWSTSESTIKVKILVLKTVFCNVLEHWLGRESHHPITIRRINPVYRDLEIIH